MGFIPITLVSCIHFVFHVSDSDPICPFDRTDCGQNIFIQRILRLKLYSVCIGGISFKGTLPLLMFPIVMIPNVGQKVIDYSIRNTFPIFLNTFTRCASCTRLNHQRERERDIAKRPSFFQQHQTLSCPVLLLLVFFLYLLLLLLLLRVKCRWLVFFFPYLVKFDTLRCWSPRFSIPHPLSISSTYLAWC